MFENWIIPCNVRFFDLIKHFEENKTVVWKNAFTIREGDIAYIYIGRPYGEIKYNRELYSYVLFLKARQQGLKVNYNEEYTDNAEKFAYYDNKQGEQVQVVYKNKEGVGYCYIAKKTDGTEMIYYVDIDGILDYVDKTIKK